jgi:hypothetical protein
LQARIQVAELNRHCGADAQLQRQLNGTNTFADKLNGETLELFLRIQKTFSRSLNYHFIAGRSSGLS